MTLSLLKPTRQIAREKTLKLNLMRSSSKFMGEELAKNSNEAILEAKALTWEKWINSDPLVVAHIDEDAASAYLFNISEKTEHAVTLYDFFDASVLHSVRSFEFMKKLYERYEPAGLTIIGVHSPLFSFSKSKEFMTDFCKRYGIEYPVVMDNDLAIWKCFENFGWPRRILIDHNNKAILDIREDGHFALLEKNIQTVLREVSPGLSCPPLMPEAYTPNEGGTEFFFGLDQGLNALTKAAPTVPGEERVYESTENTSLHIPWLEGKWALQSESAHPTVSIAQPFTSDISVHVNIQCKNVYLVSAPKSKVAGNIPKPHKVLIFLDGKPVPEDFFGIDLQYSESRKTQIIQKGPRLRQILAKLDDRPHKLTLQVENDGYETSDFYALYFET